jgi:heat shock protein HtpX
LILGSPVSFSIETDLPISFSKNLIDFVQKQYLPKKQRIVDISRKDEGVPVLSFTILDPMGRKEVGVEISVGRPINLKISPSNTSVSPERMEEVRQDIAIMIDLFEDNVEKNTIFFAWREGEEIVPERLRGNESKPINRLFLETQILLAMVFILVSILLLPIIGWFTPIALLAIQFVFLIYSGRIVARVADWTITERDPFIHLLEYHPPLEEQDSFRQKLSKEKLSALKKDIYEQTISKMGKIDEERVHQIFLKHGLDCRPENLSSRKVDVYGLVKETSAKFGFSTPKIVVSNTIIPNASASGVSPSMGLVLITTGLLVYLNPKEIMSVLGHEFGHLKGRDPLLLYGLSAIQYIFSFYFFLDLVSSSILSFFLYYWLVMTVIYFVAKFFEARADLISAIVVGEPRVLAGALEKIGFKRLLYEKVPSYRVQEWLSLEPHPPVYFRISRLESVENPSEIKNPTMQSIRDVIQGFLKASKR